MKSFAFSFSMTMSLQSNIRNVMTVAKGKVERGRIYEKNTRDDG